MKNNNGFTLVEVIISIAVLSILSVIFLQLFVKADTILDESKILDAAIVEVTTAVEQVKGADSLEVLRSDSLYEDFTWNDGADQYQMTKTVLRDSDDDYELIIELVEDKDSNRIAGLYELKATITNLTMDEEVYQVMTSIILE